MQILAQTTSWLALILDDGVPILAIRFIEHDMARERAILEAYPGLKLAGCERSRRQCNLACATRPVAVATVARMATEAQRHVVLGRRGYVVRERQGRSPSKAPVEDV